MPKVIDDFLNELEWRGLIHQCTATGKDDQGRPYKELRDHLADPANSPRAAYIGYDPTADSLTIGNLVTIMMLVHFQRAGHQPVVLMGGGTGLIGDPSGKSAERQLLDEKTIKANVDKQRTIFGRIFQNAAKLDGRGGAEPDKDFIPPIVNNIDWLGKSELGYLEALRDYGKFFRVNEMLTNDSVRDRLQRQQGISYTEFSYIILQSLDYLNLFSNFHLYKLHQPVMLQLGGSDQWANIVNGIKLINDWFNTIVLAADLYKTLPKDRLRQIAALAEPLWPGVKEVAMPEDVFIEAQQSVADGVERRFRMLAFGLTCPLITKADGGKFGKTESGAIWLTAPQPGETGDTLKSRTTPYAYYQFWLNASDADVSKFLRIFTLLDKPTIERIEAEHTKDPAKRHAQKELAKAATLLLHGEAGLNEALGATAALFGGKRAGDTSDGGTGGGGGSAGGDLRTLSLDALTQAFAAAPTSQHARSLLESPGGLALTDLLPTTSLAKSKTEARTLLTEGSISVNGELVPKDAALARRLTPADLMHNQVIALRRGKKNWHITRWQ